MVEVVAPSLTPDSYTPISNGYAVDTVVAPSLTPDSYTRPDDPMLDLIVVAPSLTPDSYTRPQTNPRQSWPGWGFLLQKIF